MGKTILCACEDVTREEVRRAFAAGTRDVESREALHRVRHRAVPGEELPRARRSASCSALGATPARARAVHRAAAATARSRSARSRRSSRTRCRSTGACRRSDPEPRPAHPDRGARPRRAAESTARDRSPPARADVVIVGGGIMGLALAYELGAARRSPTCSCSSAAYLNAGASGRNGGGVRAQWATPTMIRLGAPLARAVRRASRSRSA